MPSPDNRRGLWISSTGVLRWANSAIPSGTGVALYNNWKLLVRKQDVNNLTVSGEYLCLRNLDEDFDRSESRYCVEES
jgi:hypothetical protein